MIRRYWPDALIACVIFAICLAVYNSTLPRNLVTPDAWHVPILFGSPGQPSGPGVRPLVLYRVVDQAPELVVADADPQVSVREVAVGIGFPFRLPDYEAEWEAVLDLGKITILPTE